MRSPRRILLVALALVAGGAAVVVGHRGAAQDVDVTTECRPAMFRAQLLTPMTGRAPRDASLVVGLFPGGDTIELPTIRLTRGRRDTSLVRTEIAPGLYRLTPDARRIYGRWNVAGIAGEPQVIFGRPGLPAAPARPVLSRVERYSVISGGAQRTELKAHFGFPTPSGVVAVVAYFGDDDTPDLFARAVPPQNEAVLWTATGTCSDLPRGASPPPEQGTVRVAFVDQYGQLSQISAPQTLAP